MAIKSTERLEQMSKATDRPSSITRVNAKWGFGDAPLKKTHRDKSEIAIKDLLYLLEGGNADLESKLESISHVKGLFSRTVKQDQWDWSTVWRLLGRPSRKPARKISQTLKEFRRSLNQGNNSAAKQHRNTLIKGINLATSIFSLHANVQIY